MPLGALLILIIFRLRRLAKICEAVIARITVDMIYTAFWKIACHVEPDEAMRQISRLVNFDPEIAARLTSGNGPSARWKPVHLPRHNPGFRIVMEQFSQSFCSKLGLSHDAPRMLIGKRPARDYESFAGFAIIRGAA
jgi:hypothetical protein